MTPEPNPDPAAQPFDYAPLDAPPSLGSVLAALLKEPGRISFEIAQGRNAVVMAALLTLTIAALAIYGVVVGSLSGAAQYWIAPAKILLGSAGAALICLPSLYVFLCMSGANAQLRPVAGLLTAAICLMAVLLVSLSPIAWIFSQSTESVPLMGFLHLLLWVVAAGFGLRLLQNLAGLVWGAASGRLLAWIAIYLLVCLQMMTALRPIIGTSEHFFPTEKCFFLAHWAQVIGGGGSSYR